MEHEWIFVNFSYAGWVECTCGYRPEDQETMDDHTNEYNITEGSLA